MQQQAVLPPFQRNVRPKTISINHVSVLTLKIISLQCQQKSATGFYPEPDEICPYPVSLKSTSVISFH
jgi:hypothetical protein